MNANAKRLAKHYYAPTTRSESQDILKICQNPRGVVFVSRAIFALLRPVRSDMPQSWDRQLYEDDSTADAWYIHLLTGDLKQALRLATQVLSPLPYIVFFRGKRSAKPHRIRWATFERFVKTHFSK